MFTFRILLLDHQIRPIDGNNSCWTSKKKGLWTMTERWGGPANNPVQEVGKSVCSRWLNHHAAASAVVMSCSQFTAAPHSRDTSRGMTSFDPGIYLDHNET
jgi:hypothetical protein